MSADKQNRTPGAPCARTGIQRLIDDETGEVLGQKYRARLPHEEVRPEPGVRERARAQRKRARKAKQR